MNTKWYVINSKFLFLRSYNHGMKILSYCYLNICYLVQVLNSIDVNDMSVSQNITDNNEANKKDGTHQVCFFVIDVKTFPFSIQ